MVATVPESKATSATHDAMLITPSTSTAPREKDSQPQPSAPAVHERVLSPSATIDAQPDRQVTGLPREKLQPPQTMAGNTLSKAAMEREHHNALMEDAIARQGGARPKTSRGRYRETDLDQRHTPPLTEAPLDLRGRMPIVVKPGPTDLTLYPADTETGDPEIQFKNKLQNLSPKPDQDATQPYRPKAERVPHLPSQTPLTPYNTPAQGDVKPLHRQFKQEHVSLPDRDPREDLQRPPGNPQWPHYQDPYSYPQGKVYPPSQGLERRDDWAYPHYRDPSTMEAPLRADEVRNIVEDVTTRVIQEWTNQFQREMAFDRRENEFERDHLRDEMIHRIKMSTPREASKAQTHQHLPGTTDLSSMSKPGDMEDEQDASMEFTPTIQRTPTKRSRKQDLSEQVHKKRRSSSTERLETDIPFVTQKDPPLPHQDDDSVILVPETPPDERPSQVHLPQLTALEHTVSRLGETVDRFLELSLKNQEQTQRQGHGPLCDYCSSAGHTVDNCPMRQEDNSDTEDSDDGIGGQGNPTDPYGHGELPGQQTPPHPSHPPPPPPPPSYPAHIQPVAQSAHQTILLDTSGFMPHHDPKDRFKALIFNPETSDWKDYYAQFCNNAVANNWDLQQKRHMLVSMLDGQARGVFADHEEASFDELVRLLERRFAPPSRKKAWHFLFRARKFKKGEKPEAYGGELERLARKAYPGSTDASLDMMVVNQFIEGLADDPKLHEHISLAPIESLDDAIVWTSQYQSYRLERDSSSGTKKAVTPTKTQPVKAPASTSTGTVNYVTGQSDQGNNKNKWKGQGKGKYNQGKGNNKGGKDKKQRNQRTDFDCKYCQIYGHAWKDCRRRLRDDASWTPQYRKSNDQPKKDSTHSSTSTSGRDRKPDWKGKGQMQKGKVNKVTTLDLLFDSDGEEEEENQQQGNQ